VTSSADDDARANARLRGLAIHFAAYLVIGGGAVAANLLIYPQTLFSAFLLVLWGAPLALHVAFVMGLFNSFRGKNNGR